jgi:hypothetical protein
MSRLADQIDTAGFEALKGYGFPVHVSPDRRTRSVAVAERCRRVLDWLTRTFGERPPFTLFVAAPEDWKRVAFIPLYGMPHAVGERVVTGIQPAGFWDEYADLLLDHLGPADRRRMHAVYGDPPKLGEQFADLVVAHELTHLFHEFDEATGQTDFPRLWVAELFANIGLHGYIADIEPDQLPALETICQLTWHGPAAPWRVRDLDRMEDGLADGPLNYLWFEFRLLVVARTIWNTGGLSALRTFRTTLQRRSLTDAQILDAITAIAPDAATALRHWPA